MNRRAEAVSTLQQGIQFNPYDAEVYRQLTKIYFTLNQPKKGYKVAGHGVQRFPQDDVIREAMHKCGTSPGTTP